MSFGGEQHRQKLYIGETMSAHKRMARPAGC
jgi:hypothetical protein